MRLRDRRAIITGGSSGIGFEAARLFVAEGAHVALIGRSKERLDQAVAGLGSAAFAVPADVTSPNALAEAMRVIGQRFEGVDVVFANAGISDTPDIADLTEAAFDAMIGTNLKGAVFTVVHALPLLRDGASIVLTGSVAGRKGRPGDALYAASKGAVRSFGRTLAMDEALLARHVRVNVVTPGATRTALTAAATEDAVVSAAVAAMVPMGRWGEAREVAEAVLFLASSASSYITGAEITVDGGLSHV